MTTAVETLTPASPIVCAHRGGVEIVDSLADEWRELCSEALDDRPFYRPEFIGAHIRNMLPEAKVVLITARLNGRLQMVLPLVEERGTFYKVPLRRLRAPVDFNCGRFDAVRRSGPEGDAAIRATWKYLKGIPGWDLLHFRDTLDDSAISQLLEEARADGFLTFQTPETWNPYGPIPSDPELLQKMPPNSKLRRELRRRRRRLEELGRLNFYRTATADRNAINRFFELEASGWKGRNNSAVNCHAPTREFFNELAESAARFGYFSLYLLELDGQLLAGHFSLHYNGRCHSPVVAYNEDFRQAAPGHLIMIEIMRDCAERGIHTFDITGQDQPWKLEWMPLKFSFRNRLVFKGPVGRLAYAVGVSVGPTVGRWLAGRKPSDQPEDSLPSEQAK